MGDAWPVTYRRKIRYSDSDAQGIVFNANYLVYFDDTITDFFDVIGLPWSDLTARGFDMVLARVELDFRSSPSIGDTVATRARVESVGDTSLAFHLVTHNETTDQLVVEGKEVQVVVDAHDFRPARIPGFLITAIESVQGPLTQRETRP